MERKRQKTNNLFHQKCPLTTKEKLHVVLSDDGGCEMYKSKHNPNFNPVWTERGQDEDILRDICNNCSRQRAGWGSKLIEL